MYLCNYLLLLATDTTLQVVVVSRRAQGGICWSTCCVCYSVSSCVFVFLCVCVSICALICYHRPQTGGWEWDDGQTAGTRCRVSGNRHSSPPAAALIYALLSYPIWIYGRVAEVVRGHRGPPPKSLDSNEKFQPEHTPFCRELRFVAIFALFGDLWAKKVPFWAWLQMWTDL